MSNTPSLSVDRTERLATFVKWVDVHIKGDEKGEAQIFLDRLFQAFGQPGSLDVGGSPEFRVRKGKDETGGTSFADYVWKPIVLIEMKKRGEDLAKHRQQMSRYWYDIAPNRPAYSVLCNFDEFWIYDFNQNPHKPADKLRLADLPHRYGPLAFLFPTIEAPTFDVDTEAVTRKAADHLAYIFNHMVRVRKVDRTLAQRFVLQMLVALFSEDIGLLEKYFVAHLLQDIKDPKDSHDLLGELFDAMNRRDGTAGGRFKGVQYFNGGLFKVPARIELHENELAHLRQAAKDDWSKVSPDIFGTIFQHSMDDGTFERDERRAFGAHYTSPVDIMKIVKPTIVDPWTQLIEAATSPQQLLDLLQRLTLFRVLDPACGSGNFLYLAYRELKFLEVAIRDRLRVEFPKVQAPLLHVNARQFYGIDVLPFAVELAKVTMMLGRKLAIDDLHISDESALPLDNLDDNFICNDALLECSVAPHFYLTVHSASDVPAHAHRMSVWPPVDVIIGNPPFLGAKLLKPERGPEYVNTLRELYPEIPGMADYCVYWFRRAHDHLPVCTSDRPEIGRAGLVGTQNIRNNQSRVGGLDHIVKTGVIVEAVDNQPWSGEANVHVSIANWVKLHEERGDKDANDPAPPPFRSSGTQGGDRIARELCRNLDRNVLAKHLFIPRDRKLWFKTSGGGSASVRTPGRRSRALASKSYGLSYRETACISAALSDAADTTAVGALACNTEPQRVFNGQYPRHAGFRLATDEAAKMIAADPKNAEVVHPFLVGATMLTLGRPDEWVIDFQRRTILEARAYPLPFRKLQRDVLPHLEKLAAAERARSGKATGQDQNWLRMWWQHFRSRIEMHAAIGDKGRYIACCEVTKRPIFCFVHRDIRPDKTMEVFTFDDDYSFGVLQSDPHRIWFWAKCSHMKSDPRYTPESVFDTFPWPQSPTKAQVEAVAEAGRKVRQVRAAALATMTGGLRALYRTLELPGQNPLKDAHSTLDAAVLAAYGFDSKDDLLAQLLALNVQVAADFDAGKPVTAPGVPATYGSPASLVTKDCIAP